LLLETSDANPFAVSAEEKEKALSCYSEAIHKLQFGDTKKTRLALPVEC